MEKSSILLFIISFFFSLNFSTNLSSQVWLQEAQSWEYTVIHGFPPSAPKLVTMKVEGDTILLGKVCKKITHTPASSTYNLGTSYAYHENDAVFSFQPELNEFIKIYDFALQPGDSVNLLFGDKYIIDSIGTMAVDGQTRKFQIIDFYSWPFEFKRLVIEGIGMVGRPSLNSAITCAYFFVEREFYGLSFDGRDIYFMCFHHDDFFFNPYGNCSSSSLSPVYSKVPNVFPNPVSHILNIELGNNDPVVLLSVEDIYGRKVVYPGLTSNQIYVGDISPGLYYLKIKLKNGQMHSAKIVVDR